MTPDDHRRRRLAVFALAATIWPAVLASWAIAMLVSPAPRDWFGIPDSSEMLDASMAVTAASAVAALAAPHSARVRWVLLNVGAFSLIGRVVSLGLGDSAFPLLAAPDRLVAVSSYCGMLLGHVIAHFLWIAHEVDRAAARALAADQSRDLGA